jgi:hypothetical protein
VPQDGGGFERAEDFGGLSIAALETCGKAFVGAEFRNVRPEIDLRIAIRERAALLRPMNPAALRAIAFRIKPPLVTAHHLAFERACIHTFFSLAHLRMQRLREYRLARIVSHGMRRRTYEGDEQQRTETVRVQGERAGAPASMRAT